MKLTEKTIEEECCCTCVHNICEQDGKYMSCHCDIDGHDIGYVECFEGIYERWENNYE